MRRFFVLALVLLACGRSAPFDPQAPVAPPITAQPGPPPGSTSSALLGHWASFQIGNCINDEAWLSFEGTSTLTVTSVNRNFCYPGGVSATKGTFKESADTLTLSWSPPEGSRSLETSFSILPRGAGAYLPQTGYQLGTRTLATGVWHGTPAHFSRMSSERITEKGVLYARDVHAEVTFDVSVGPQSPAGPCVATLTWDSKLNWGSEPARSLHETFSLPCRITVEGDQRQVKALALDSYDGFWKILEARGLPSSYGWDLDRLAHDFGPSWTVGADGRLYQRSPAYSPSYLELNNGPPSSL